MAKKSFVLSNGDGRVTFSNINSASIDDGISAVSGAISSSNLYISNTFRVGNFVSNNVTSSLLSSSGGTGFLTSSLTGTVALSGCVGWNGTTYVVTNILNPSDYGGTSTGTWISGAYQENSRVVNIETVSSGALKPAYGGTGLSGSQYGNSNKFILKGSGSAPTSFSTLSASASGTIIVSGEGRFNVQYPSYKPDVRFYGTPGTYTWTRPIGARFARVILQGAGGGGGGGAATTYTGSGGGSGGYSDITLDVSSLNSCSVIVGSGGNGGNSGANGSIGGSTSFNASYISYGGNNGAVGSNAAANGGTGGSGLTRSGGKGAASIGGVAAVTVYDIPSGGGASGLPGTVISTVQNKNFGYTYSTDGISISIINASGSAVGSGKPGYGAGGSGGRPANSGSQGGDGYALIISW